MEILASGVIAFAKIMRSPLGHLPLNGGSATREDLRRGQGNNGSIHALLLQIVSAGDRELWTKF